MIKKIVCYFKGHSFRRGYFNGYAWEKCGRCQTLGEPMTGKPKKRR
ncbi:hypothetical protein [Metabacillus fastidiosus]|uniref:Uncharacterized protein n=1 Tax=Metabacillus fastidiosus TaxID=1458 RepID=A0ABU6NVH0_9BACI|nr:hypothetical protein [Metabacillus fastidiosus]